jgi:hypothetical protein
VADSRSYAAAGWIFRRLLGLVYLLAFWSLGTQILGLVGAHGILPAREYMEAARIWAASQHIGLNRYHLLPTVFWISTTDGFLKGVCFTGMGLAALLIAGIAPLVVLPCLWAAYLSLAVVCREFLGYQWDALLLETGMLATALGPAAWLDRLRARRDPPRIGVWLMLWLLFRLMLGSGLVKLASGDPTWRSLEALRFYYETQPIPSPLAFYAHHLPVAVHQLATFATLAIELAVPFLILGTRRWRTTAFVLFVGLQATIAATGNYAFFNLLAAALCLFLLDDATLKITDTARTARLPERSGAFGVPASDGDPGPPPRGLCAVGWGGGSGGAKPPGLDVHRGWVIALAVVVAPVSAYTFTASVGLRLPGASLIESPAAFLEPLRSVNSYGLFAVMTTARPEIIVFGSDDGERWSAYEFKYKPGDVSRRPPQVAPHQPRLDWQMWFAALVPYQDAPWFQQFCVRLLEASPDVRRLLAYDPFKGRRPRYIRSTLYRYHFADRMTHGQGGVWWTRELLGEYSPVMSLEEPSKKSP